MFLLLSIYKNIFVFGIIYIYNFIINIHSVFLNVFLYKFYVLYKLDKNTNNNVNKIIKNNYNIIKYNNNTTSYVYRIGDYIVKLEDKIIFINSLLIQNEKFFYNYIRKEIKNIKIPKCSINNLDMICLKFIKNNKNNYNANDILKVINSIHKLHIKYWNKQHNIKFLNNNNTINEFMILIYKYSDLVYITNKNLYYTFKNVAITLPIYGNTLIHGDLKPDNILFNNDKNIYFIDWSLYRIGYGVEDILMLMIFSLNTNKLQKYFMIILMYYFKLINVYHTYTITEFIEHIKISIRGIISYYVIGIEMNNFISYKCNKNIINNYYFLIKYFHIE